MAKFHQTFTIHPVGQGLFYSGQVTYRSPLRSEAHFRMVYDCGSLNKANREEEVHSVTGSMLSGDAPLDLLVVSHFDADHVNGIQQLLGTRQVKKLVLPFLGFAERLYLVLRFLRARGGYRDDDDFTVRFIVDPLGTIGENLGGDTGIFLVDHDPAGPDLSPAKELPVVDTFFGNENGDLFFDFEGNKPQLTFPEQQFFLTRFPAGRQVAKVLDSQRGFLGYQVSMLVLMEFLFYRRSLGAGEKAFFDKVKSLFFDHFNINPSTTPEEQLDAVVEKVKGLKGATIIRELFQKAKDVTEVRAPRRDVTNMNTTALCLMHRNLNAIYDLPGLDGAGGKPFLYEDHQVQSIRKHDGTNSTRDLGYLLQESWGGRRWPYYRSEFTFPNTLLTSDSFLLHPEEVDPFYKKYAPYWQRYWLFQVPHHGSEKNANGNLFSKLEYDTFNFVNYGTVHPMVKKWRHPSPAVIRDLVVTRQSLNLLPVNEFNGLCFEYILDKN